MTIATLNKTERQFSSLRTADAVDFDVAAQLIEGGIARINEYGWTQRQYGNETFGMCALGSLPFDADFDQRSLASMLLHTAAPTGDMVDFNDAKGRRKREVISKMRRAARRARALARAKRLGKI
jgi:hypothetical protein